MLTFVRKTTISVLFWNSFKLTHTHYKKNRVACFLPFLFVAFNWIVMKVMGLFGKKVENPPVEKIQEKNEVKSCRKGGGCEGTCSTSAETKGDNRMKID